MSVHHALGIYSEREKRQKSRSRAVGVGVSEVPMISLSYSFTSHFTTAENLNLFHSCFDINHHEV